jgi:hypothetical protein
MTRIEAAAVAVQIIECLNRRMEAKHETGN